MKQNFNVIGYYAGWGGFKKEKLDFSVLTHLVYAFAIPTEEGHLREIEHPDVLEKLIEETHRAGRKIAIAIGGWSYLDVPLEATFVKATESPEKIKTLADEIVELCMKYDADGIDIDWEHPRMKGCTYKQYEALILYLSKELHQRGKYLSSAVLSGVTWDGKVWEDSACHVDTVLEAVDLLNVMTYDGGEGVKHSTYDFAVNCAEYWLNTRKLPKEKMMLGLPFYSYQPPCSYERLLEVDPNAGKKDLVIMDGKEYHYNGCETIAKKTDYALKHCGGVMIWEITEDTDNKEYSLLQTIKRQCQ